MTVRIIKEEPDKSVIKQVICERCGVTLEYLPIDVQIHTTPHEWGSYDSVSYIKCLKCNNTIYVDEHK